MNNQLSNISIQYRKFSKGQYIEHTQFNEFLDFFEDQDRLSRVLLQGVGIVCGLKPQLIYAGGLLNSVQLSQGVAITTDGDLLTLNNTNKVSEDLYVSDLKTIDIENKKYTHFKVYDNFKVKYPAFHDENGSQVELWELATAEEAGSGFQSISNFPNLENQYLLLYLENYEKEVRPCRGVDCDNHGVQQIRNLKVLVTTAKGISHILERDHMQPHPLFIDHIMGAVKQERVVVERLILNKGIETQFFSSDLKELYATVLEKNEYGKVVFDKIAAISQIMGIPAADYQSFKNTLEKFLIQRTGFQYAYDVIKDLMDTYSEIIKLLPKAFTKCLPDVVSFPKHIMLGKLISNTQLDSSRHKFYNSPVLDDEKATQRVKILINRFNLQVQNFKDFNSLENKAPIKITPSQKLDPLSGKAVPFYYQITEEFLKAWNFDKTSSRSFGDNLGYDTSLLSPDAHIQKPIDFNIDRNSFYNIEGHQGMDYQMAVEQIEEIRNKQQLGLGIMVLSLEELTNNKDLLKAYFNEYVEKHPGLEHKRGVERGGTFVMVYESLKSPKVIADFSLPYLCCSKEKPNIPPIAVDDRVSCLSGTTVIISVLDNDYDPDEKPLPLTVVKMSNPSHGTLVLNSGGTFSYTHNGSANLEDSFTYCVNDGRDKSNIATVFIGIKSPPVAVDDHASTQLGGSVNIAVKDNDYDLGNTPLTVIIRTQPSHGTAVLNADGTIRYTHDGSVNLTDTFTYYINDGELDSNIATVFIGIKSPPVAVDDYASTELGGFIDIAVKDNDYDLGDTPLTVIIRTQPSHGTAVLNADGTVRYTHNGSPGLTDSFTYYINDGELDSNVATVNISIAPPPCDSGMDVVFIFDYTGSMGGQIEAAKTGAGSIISAIQSQSAPNPYRLGIVLADEYDSGTASNYSSASEYTVLPAAQRFINTGINSKYQWLTAMELMSDNNVSSFTNQLNKLNNPTSGLALGYGSGGPEPTDMTLSRVVEYDFAGAFRNNVAKYIIIITDITPGGNDDNADSLDVAEMDRLKNVCLAKSIKVIVLGDGVNSQIDGVYIWRALAEGTGGSWNPSYNASAIQSAIINGCGGVIPT